MTHGDAQDIPRQRVAVWFWGRRGGGSQFSHALTAALRDEDVDVTVALRDGTAPVRVGAGAATVRQVVTRLGPMQVLLARRTASRAMRQIEGTGADVVVFTMAHPLLLTCVAAARRVGLGTVVVVHDGAPHPGDRNRWVTRVVRAAARRADQIVVLSSHVAGAVIGWGILPERVTVIGAPPLITPTVPRPDQTRQSERTRFVFIGRGLAYKGLDVLAAAWRETVRRFPDAHLTVAGEGEPAVVEAPFRDLPGVEVLNRWLDEGEISELLLRSDVAVLPYVESSQSGVPSMAVAHGCRVLASAVGGLVEQVSADGLVPPEPGAWATALVDICSGSRTGSSRADSWQVAAERVLDAVSTARNRRVAATRPVP